MTDHTHTTLVDGCYRCELNKDEIAAITAEQDAVLAKVMRRVLTGRPDTDLEDDIAMISAPYGAREGWTLLLDGRLELDEQEFDVLSDVMDFDEVPE